jgi:TolB-like protein
MSERPSFLAELKRRNVLRAATFYAASAWLVVQVATHVFPFFHIAEWVVRCIVVAAAIGFPFAMAFSWFYEWTPQGIQRENEVAPESSVTSDTGKKLERWTIAVLGLAVVLLLADRFVLHRDAEAATSASTDKSIAVLPLRNLSADKDNVYFADALGEEIINSLTRTPELHVASRTASFAFRDSSKPISEIAAKLGVATLLEGSVQRSGDKLRVTVQLVRAADGFELWSENYDRTSKDVIAVEEDVARSIATALKIATDPKALAAMQHAGTRSVPAYEAYLKCLALYFKSIATGDYDLYTEAIASAHEATSIDPGFGDAYGAAALVEGIITDPTTIKTQAITAIPFAERMRMLRVDLDGAIANARNPVERKKYRAVQASLDVRLKDASALMSDYLRENPNDPYAQDTLATWSVMLGDFARARALAEALARVGPTGLNNEPMLTMLRARAARRAAELARQGIAQEPDSIEVLYQAHRALLSVGATQDAARLLPQLLASDLPDAAKRMLRIRQACAEGRRADAEALVDPTPDTDDYGRSLQWQQFLLLGRTEDARHLLERYDTPEQLYALSTYMAYPMFDAKQYPLLLKTLASQGIKPLLPQPEAYACKPETASR